MGKDGKKTLIFLFQKYDKFWSILPGQKHLISEEWCTYVGNRYFSTVRSSVKDYVNFIDMGLFSRHVSKILSKKRGFSIESSLHTYIHPT